jgi:site-specific DNA recombinase
MSNAALYARISSLKDDKGVSVERQLDECIRLAKSHGYTIAPEHIYIDNGKSGKNLKRPAIQALLKAIESGAVSHLFIWDIARLSRSVRDTDILLELLGKHKVELFTVSGFSDVTTPEGELLTGFQAQMAQYWRRKTSKSVKDHYAYLRSQGVYLGRRAPFGLVLVGNGKTRRVEPHPDQFPAVVAFFEMYASGEAFASQRGTRLLFERGHLWQDRHGNRFKVTPSHLKKLLANVPLFLPRLFPPGTL